MCVRMGLCVVQVGQPVGVGCLSTGDGKYDPNFVIRIY